MKFQFKRQKFQAEAAQAIVDVFAGQPKDGVREYQIDPGRIAAPSLIQDDFIGFRNAPVVPDLTDERVLERIVKIQRERQIKPSAKLEGRYNLTVEMETGVGKTYAYIKTIYELNKHYGWSKFIVVVPSVAVREGVYKTFQITEEHFAEEYGKKIRYFVYNSMRLTEIDRFASDGSINVMIVNSQAFNAKGKDARRIRMELDEFRSRRPIDVIAKTNPIIIIDEPQSVEGKQTKESLKDFNPLMTLRYSATHRSDSIYNMVYRLDAQEAYNKRLVKKIAVKGVSTSGTSATNGYVYLESVNLSQVSPTASIRFDRKGANGVRQKTMKAEKGFNLYDHSGELEEYRNGFVVADIDGRDNSVTFQNGVKIYVGDAIGNVAEDELRRVQIRETILSHLERERALFSKGIKVLSLFFIDEVAKYRTYDDEGSPQNGLYAKMFEEEYAEVVAEQEKSLDSQSEYAAYLRSISAEQTHAGYFSIDKKGKMTDGAIDKKERSSNDVDAYDLIMKDKERLLDRDARRSPVRFIFSHSALREGWDNPNVFQICTLKQSSSEVRKRQEVGRGLRLCVNQNGERMDANTLDDAVHDVNVLTVIASESYDEFAKGLQAEMAEAIGDRPRKVDKELFKGKTLVDANGEKQTVDATTAGKIYKDLILKGYVDVENDELTEKYYDDKKRGAVELAEEIAEYADSILEILDSVYDARATLPEDARKNNVTLCVDQEKLASAQFKELWNRISPKSAYRVDFDSDELVANAIKTLDEKLRVAQIYVDVVQGELSEIESKEALQEGSAFRKTQTGDRYELKSTSARRGVKYDLIGKLAEETSLTRKTIADILVGIKETTFAQFQRNPEEFVAKAASLINDEKATVVIQHITYGLLDERYNADIFTDATIKGRLNVNAIDTKKRHLYDRLVYDSETERQFAENLEADENVVVYVKLPSGFYITTPVGKYNPDWAIAFKEGAIKHIYFVAETKGSTSSLQLREIEKIKIDCAKKHFSALNAADVVYEVVESYRDLCDKVMR